MSSELRRHVAKIAKARFERWWRRISLWRRWRFDLLALRWARLTRGKHGGEEAATQIVEAFLAREAPVIPTEVAAYASLWKRVEALVGTRRLSADKAELLAQLLQEAGAHARARDLFLILLRAGLNKTAALQGYLEAELKANGRAAAFVALNAHEAELSDPRMRRMADELLRWPDPEHAMEKAEAATLLRLILSRGGPRLARAAARRRLGAMLEAMSPTEFAALALEGDLPPKAIAGFCSAGYLGASASKLQTMAQAAQDVLTPVERILDAPSPAAAAWALEAARAEADPKTERLFAFAASLKGCRPLEALFSSEEAPLLDAPPRAREGLLVVSLAAVPEDLMARLRSAQPKVVHVSMKASPGALSMQEVLVPHNSPDDHEAAFEAEAFGARLAEAIFSEADPELRGVWALSLADRSFGMFKRARSLEALRRRESCDQVLVAMDKGDWTQPLSLAAALAVGGAQVWTIWPKMGQHPPRRLLARSPWRRAADPLAVLMAGRGDGSEKPDAWAKAALDRVSQARSPEAGPFGPLVEEAPLRALEADLAQDGRPLIYAGLSDPSYFAAAQSLLGRLREQGRGFLLVECAQAAALPEGFAPRQIMPSVALTGAPEAMEAILAEAERRALAFLHGLDSADLSPGAFMTAPRLHGILRAVLNDCAVEMVAARRLIEKGRPGCLTTLPGRAPEMRAATILARRAGIPTVDVQAFYVSGHPRYKPSLADVYCAITTDQAELYKTEIGAPAGQRIAVIGSLAMDQRLSAVRGLSKAEARRRLDMDPQARVLLFGAQHGSGEEGKRILDLLIDMAGGWPEDWRLAIKLHPRETAGVEENLARRVAASAGRAKISVSRAQSIYEMIAAADVVATQFSNVGLEAAALGRPVLAINLTEAEYAVDLAGIGLTERVSSAGELRERVAFWMSAASGGAAAAPEAEAYFARNPHLRGGGAAEAAVDVMDASTEAAAAAAAARTAPIRASGPS